MQCEMCGKKKATTFMAIMVNEQVKEMHLCDACATESGVDGSKSISFADVILGLGSKKNTEETSRRVCARCRMRFSDFKKTARLGCAHCYEAFAEELAPLLEASQKGWVHAGKVPGRFVAREPSSRQTASLREALAAAVKAENYEEAARIRDRIHACSVSPKTAGENNENSE